MNPMAHPSPSFAKLSKTEKMDLVAQACGVDLAVLKSFWHADPKVQELFDHLAENTLSNFILPYGIVPRLVVNGKTYWVPLATEESSVVAAASKSAKFWGKWGGITTTVGPQIKNGQVHFWWHGEKQALYEVFQQHQQALHAVLAPLAATMQERGGGIVDLRLADNFPLKDYYQLFLRVKTCAAMGANFINTLLEALAQQWQKLIAPQGEIIMAILSNHTPECWAEAVATCPVEALASGPLPGPAVAAKLVMATEIAQVDPYRAATHNKGIMNGVDAFLIATGNDFRAVEAAAHTAAAASGKYQGLSQAEVHDGQFSLKLKLPLAVGTVGGVTSIHPLAKFSLALLQNPSVEELMQIAVALGLCQNFAALRALVTTGIQQGHMRMHLANLLAAAEANQEEQAAAQAYFKDQVVSGGAVREFLARMRQAH